MGGGAWGAYNQFLSFLRGGGSSLPYQKGLYQQARDWNKGYRQRLAYNKKIWRGGKALVPYSSGKQVVKFKKKFHKKKLGVLATNNYAAVNIGRSRGTSSRGFRPVRVFSCFPYRKKRRHRKKRY